MERTSDDRFVNVVAPVAVVAFDDDDVTNAVADDVDDKNVLGLDLMASNDLAFVSCAVDSMDTFVSVDPLHSDPHFRQM